MLFEQKLIDEHHCTWGGGVVTSPLIRLMSAPDLRCRRRDAAEHSGHAVPNSTLVC